MEHKVAKYIQIKEDIISDIKSGMFSLETKWTASLP